MGIKLSELELESTITLQISNGNSTMSLKAVIKRIVKEDIAIISLDYEGSNRLVFDKVLINVEYNQDDDVPIIWRNVKVVNYKNDYILQVFSEGTKHNRRGCFRVPVAMQARLSMVGKGVEQVMVKDISLSGFSITDRKKELNLSKGDELAIFFEDRGHILDLAGRVVRIEEHEDMIIYGLEICNLCKDLSSYISIRQRQKR